MDKGFRLLWYICMGEVQVYNLLSKHKIALYLCPHDLLKKGLLTSLKNCIIRSAIALLILIEIKRLLIAWLIPVNALFHHNFVDNSWRLWITFQD